jgi:chromate transporter
MRDIFQLFITFLKIGTFTFGGGYAMIPAIRRETVAKRGWIDEEGIADCLAISQSLPGAFAVNVSIFIGKKIKGTLGALTACLGLVLPAYLVILLILIFLGTIDDNVYVIGAFEGIKAASVALILLTTIQLGKSILKSKVSYVVAIFSFAVIVVFSFNAVYTIIAGGFIGLIQYKCHKDKEAKQ